MKAKIISAILGAAGLAGLAVSSFGQGAVFFDNYNASPYFQVMLYGYGPIGGTPAGSNVNVELGYALGANQTTGFTLIPSSITAVSPQIPGYFQGPIVTIPDYVSGPITFEILISMQWIGIGPGFFGVNYVWTEPSVSVLPNLPGFFTALPGPIRIEITPEPSTLTLVALGALASLAAFHRKQS